MIYKHFSFSDSETFLNLEKIISNKNKELINVIKKQATIKVEEAIKWLKTDDGKKWISEEKINQAQAAKSNPNQGPRVFEYSMPDGSVNFFTLQDLEFMSSSQFNKAKPPSAGQQFESSLRDAKTTADIDKVLQDRINQINSRGQVRDFKTGKLRSMNSDEKQKYIDEATRMAEIAKYEKELKDNNMPFIDDWSGYTDEELSKYREMKQRGQLANGPGRGNKGKGFAQANGLDKTNQESNSNSEKDDGDWDDESDGIDGGNGSVPPKTHNGIMPRDGGVPSTKIINPSTGAPATNPTLPSEDGSTRRGRSSQESGPISSNADGSHGGKTKDQIMETIVESIKTQVESSIRQSGVQEAAKRTSDWLDILISALQIINADVATTVQVSDIIGSTIRSILNEDVSRGISLLILSAVTGLKIYLMFRQSGLAMSQILKNLTISGVKEGGKYVITRAGKVFTVSAFKEIFKNAFNPFNEMKSLFLSKAWKSLLMNIVGRAFQARAIYDLTGKTVQTVKYDPEQERLSKIDYQTSLRAEAVKCVDQILLDSEKMTSECLGHLNRLQSENNSYYQQLVQTAQSSKGK